MGHYNFSKDLKFGNIGEEIVAKYLTKCYGAKLIGKSDVISENHKHFDLSFEFPHSKNVTYEVKSEDIYIIPRKVLPNGKVFPGKDTGNLFIEYMCYQKDSGIMVTKADWWAQVLVHIGEIWFIKSNELKSLLNEKDYPKTIGGDSKDRQGNLIKEEDRAHGYLLPRKEVEEHFIIKKFNIKNLFLKFHYSSI